MAKTAFTSLSLLDRLIDDTPEQMIEPIMSEAQMLDLIKQGLRRDLEGLLNSKQPYSTWLSDEPTLSGTIVDFGLPDLSTEDFGTAAVRERIRRMIAKTIKAHEPRLRQVEVETDGGPTATGVRFRINAVLTFSENAEEVTYEAQLRPSDRAIDVELAV
jgi:type VI secretion system protein ImpF